MSLLDLFSSSISTIFAEMATIPICTVKTIYQTDLTHKSVIDVTKKIYYQRGLYGFYNSWGSAISSQIVSTSTKFTFYNLIKKKRNTAQSDLKNNIINGSLSGVMSSLFTHPVDVIKVHQQNNLSVLSEYNKTGVSLFYRGFSKSLLKSILLTSLIFPFYDLYKSKLNNTFISAGLSSITVALLLHPLDYLKIRHISNKNLYMNNYNLLTNLKYYYRGLHINLLRIIPNFAITMTMTEWIKDKIKE